MTNEEALLKAQKASQFEFDVSFNSAYALGKKYYVRMQVGGQETRGWGNSWEEAFDDFEKRRNT